MKRKDSDKPNPVSAKSRKKEVKADIAASGKPSARKQTKRVGPKTVRTGIPKKADVKAGGRAGTSKKQVVGKAATGGKQKEETAKSVKRRVVKSVEKSEKVTKPPVARTKQKARPKVARNRTAEKDLERAPAGRERKLSGVITAKRPAVAAAVRKKKEKPGKKPGRPGTTQESETVSAAKVSIRRGKRKSGQEHRRTPADEHPPVAWEILPAEYGTNNITLMTVDPYKLFVFWEIKEAVLSEHRGDLNIRVYDVTDLDRIDASRHFDVSLTARIGKGYLDVYPAGEFIADIGVIAGGIFTYVARSRRVSTPDDGARKADSLSRERPGTIPRTGY